MTPEERQKLVDESNAVDEWLATTMSHLDRQPKHENPHTTIQQIKAKKDALDKVHTTPTHRTALHRYTARAPAYQWMQTLTCCALLCRCVVG